MTQLVTTANRQPAHADGSFCIKASPGLEIAVTRQNGLSVPLGGVEFRPAAEAAARSAPVWPRV